MGKNLTRTAPTTKATFINQPAQTSDVSGIRRAGDRYAQSALDGIPMAEEVAANALKDLELKAKKAGEAEAAEINWWRDPDTGLTTINTSLFKSQNTVQGAAFNALAQKTYATRLSNDIKARLQKESLRGEFQDNPEAYQKWAENWTSGIIKNAHFTAKPTLLEQTQITTNAIVDRIANAKLQRDITIANKTIENEEATLLNDGISVAIANGIPNDYSMQILGDQTGIIKVDKLHPLIKKRNQYKEHLKNNPSVYGNNEKLIESKLLEFDRSVFIEIGVRNFRTANEDIRRADIINLKTRNYEKLKSFNGKMFKSLKFDKDDIDDIITNFEKFNISLSKQEDLQDRLAMGNMLGVVLNVVKEQSPEIYEALMDAEDAEGIMRNPDPAQLKNVLTMIDKIRTSENLKEDNNLNILALRSTVNWLSNSPDKDAFSAVFGKYQKLINDEKNPIRNPGKRLQLLNKLISLHEKEFNNNVDDAEIQRTRLISNAQNEGSRTIPQTKKNADSAFNVISPTLSIAFAVKAEDSQDPLANGDIASKKVLTRKGMLELYDDPDLSVMMLEKSLQFTTRTGVVDSVTQEYIQKLYNSSDQAKIAIAAGWVMSYVRRTGNQPSVAGKGFGNHGANMMNNLYQFALDGGMTDAAPSPSQGTDVSTPLSRFFKRKAGDTIATDSERKAAIIEANYKGEESPTTEFTNAFNKAYTKELGKFNAVSNADFRDAIETIFYANPIKDSDGKFDIERMMEHAMHSITDSTEWGPKSHYDFSWVQSAASMAGMGPKYEMVRFPILKQLDNFGIDKKYNNFFLEQIENQVNKIWEERDEDTEATKLELGKNFSFIFDSVSEKGEVNYQVIINTKSKNVHSQLKTARGDIYKFTASDALKKTVGQIAKDDQKKAEEVKQLIKEASRKHFLGFYD